MKSVTFLFPWTSSSKLVFEKLCIFIFEASLMIMGNGDFLGF